MKDIFFGGGVASRKNNEGFTLLELMVVSVILVILAALLLPFVGKMKERANRVVCMGNLKQIHVAFASYTADNNGQLPPAGQWKNLTAQYLYDFENLSSADAMRKLQGKDSVYRCPSVPSETMNLTGSNTEKIHGIGWNYYYLESRLDKPNNGASPDNMIVRRSIATVNRQSTTVMLGDTYDTVSPEKWYYSHYLYPPGKGVGPGNRHDDGINVVYYDGHGEYLTREFYERPEEAYRWMYDPLDSALP